MHLDDFDFELPKSAIALRPAHPRDSARLLRVTPQAGFELSDAYVSDLPNLLQPGDIMVFNNTKVLPAQLEGERLNRGMDGPPVQISVTLMERLADGSWKGLSRPAKRLKIGDEVFFRSQDQAQNQDQTKALLSLIVLDKDDSGGVTLGPSGNASVEDVMALQAIMPLPPYIARTRPFDAKDRTDYQTVYAKVEGAVAAPTAGLHFTPQLLERLTAAGINTAFVTLHVGAGTFLPVKSDIVDRHELHAEWCEISEETAEAIRKAKARGGRVISVGTTSLRVLETASASSASNTPPDIKAYRGATRLFIKPGHKFSSADLLLTNFHLPKSTLFMLVCAFSGTDLMKRAYAHALGTGYRFYSYGDACLLERSA